MDISAKLLPLEGKYYGTRVEITTDEGCTSWVMIWHNDSSGPSSRELEGWDVEEYGEYEICDSHYETATDLLIAETIVKVVNELATTT